MSATAKPLATQDGRDMSSPYGRLGRDSTLTMERLLPGPIERVWSYLTDGKLRRRWLAAGDMEMKAASPFEFAWNNDTLTDPPGKIPEGMSGEHRMASRIVEIDPPRKITFTWQGSGDVSFVLEPQGDNVLLTVVHRRLPDRATIMKVGPGWHMHLNVLAARLDGSEPEPFWDGWRRLQQEYEERMQA